MYENFTYRSRCVIAIAKQEAQRYNHEHVGTAHLLLGIVKEGHGWGCQLLRDDLGETESIVKAVRNLLIDGPDDTFAMGPIPHTPRLRKALDAATAEAEKMNHRYVGTEHLLLAILLDTEALVGLVFKKFGVSYNGILEQYHVYFKTTPDTSGLPGYQKFHLTGDGKKQVSLSLDSLRIRYMLNGNPSIDWMFIFRRYSYGYHIQVSIDEKEIEVIVPVQQVQELLKKRLQEEGPRVTDAIATILADIVQRTNEEYAARYSKWEQILKEI